MKEAHMSIERFVDIYLFYCLKNTLHMMGNKSSVFAARYGSGLVNLHKCFQVLYIRVEEYEKSRDKIRTPWDNSLGSEKSPDIRLTYTDLQAHDDTDDLTAQTSCQLDYGSISRMPSISMCFKHDVSTRNSRLHEGTIAHCDAKGSWCNSTSLWFPVLQHQTCHHHDTFQSSMVAGKIQLWPRHHHNIVCTSTNHAQHTHQATHAQQPLCDSLCYSQWTVDDVATPRNLTVGHQMATWRSLHLCGHQYYPLSHGRCAPAPVCMHISRALPGHCRLSSQSAFRSQQEEGSAGFIMCHIGDDHRRHLLHHEHCCLVCHDQSTCTAAENMQHPEQCEWEPNSADHSQSV